MNPKATSVDRYPGECWYNAGGNLKMDFVENQTNISSSSHRYVFRKRMRVECSTDNLVTNETPVLEARTYWDEKYKAAIEYFGIGMQMLQVTYQCTADPWVEGGSCGPPKIVKGNISPVSIAGNIADRQDMATIVLRSVSPGATFTSGMLPEEFKPKLLAQVACLKAPSILAWMAPITGYEDVKRYVRVQLKAQIPSTAQLWWRWITIEYKYALIPNMDESDPVRVIPSENSRAWESVSPRYDFRENPIITSPITVDIPHTMMKGAVAVKARLCFGDSCQNNPGPWSETEVIYFKRLVSVGETLPASETPSELKAKVMKSLIKQVARKPVDIKKSGQISRAKQGGMADHLVVDGDVYLSWKDNSSGENGFIVERQSPGESSLQFRKVGEVPANRTEFVDRGPRIAGNYIYRVLAYKIIKGKKKFSEPSNPVFLKIGNRQTLPLPGAAGEPGSQRTRSLKQPLTAPSTGLRSPVLLGVPKIEAPAPNQKFVLTGNSVRIQVTAKHGAKEGVEFQVERAPLKGGTFKSAGVHLKSRSIKGKATGSFNARAGRWRVRARLAMKGAKYGPWQYFEVVPAALKLKPKKPMIKIPAMKLNKAK